MDIVREIKQSFKEGSILTRIIYINLAIFLIVNIAALFSFLGSTNGLYTSPLTKILSLPASGKALLLQPWSIITYMFLHEGFLHILFNMLWLFWFGKIFLDYLSSQQFLSTYILGGITGGLVFMLAYNAFPVFAPYVEESMALGASASVLAVVTAISFYVPNHTLHLMFIGPVKLKYIALFSIALDIISIPSGNAGGHIAHLGGALYGYLFITQFKKGKNIAGGFERFLNRLLSKFSKSKIHVSGGRKKKPGNPFAYKRPVSDMEYNARKAKEQEDIDKILEKIKKSGYDSLTKAEKEKLFKMSNKK